MFQDTCFSKIKHCTQKTATRLVLFLRLQEYKYKVNESEIEKSEWEYFKKSRIAENRVLKQHE